MDATIQQILADVPELRDQPVQVTPLGGGLTNRNYRLTSPAGDFVLRFFCRRKRSSRLTCIGLRQKPSARVPRLPTGELAWAL